MDTKDRRSQNPPPAAHAPRVSAPDLPARLLYRDGMMLVIDKPAGIPVHRGPQSATFKGGVALEDYFDVLRFGLPRAPALAHRLDRETSGCLVLGRHRKATAHLGLLFKHGEIDKTYWAIVEGGPLEDSGTINMPLGRRDETRGWWQKPDANGQEAITHWRVMGRGLDANGAALTWLALEPVTGRTHQLRVHCASSGFPILGDTIYGTAPRSGGPGLHLHAREIVIPISKNKPPARVSAPLPDHMHEAMSACGWRDDNEPLYLPPPAPRETEI